MIEILATGALCSVQDAGRRGYRKLGVGLSGAMDGLAYRAGNALVGNDADQASIEITLFPFKIRFLENTRVAITGAACGAMLDDQPMPPWWAFDAHQGQTLTLQSPKVGARAYLACLGGIDVPEILGSRSTDIKVGFGGFQGRCLRRGDVLSVMASNGEARPPAGKSFGVVPPAQALHWESGNADALTVRVVTGPEYAAFTSEGVRDFWAAAWRITPDSNRIGYRLAGPAIPLTTPLEMLSHGIVPGVIQVPPGGSPIVMMADAQTSGGYPKIATVIQADLWRLAQAPLGAHIRFVPVSVVEAAAAARQQQTYIDAIKTSLWRA